LRVAVELDQVEGIEEDIRVMVPVPDAIEGCHPVIATSHSLTIDDAGPRPQVGRVSTMNGKRLVRSLPGRL
jgi:hypothetical protein